MFTPTTSQSQNLASPSRGVDVQLLHHPMRERCNYRLLRRKSALESGSIRAIGPRGVVGKAHACMASAEPNKTAANPSLTLVAAIMLEKLL